VLGYDRLRHARDRAIDVMLAVHELAANTVRHGTVHGWLRIHVTASTLRCEVSDPGLSSRDGGVPDGAAGQPPGAVPWPVEEGHGLWLVRRAADHVRVTSGPHGSLMTVVFAHSAGPQAPRTRRRHRPLIHGTGAFMSLSVTLAVGILRRPSAFPVPVWLAS
jgi:anti-sigma regulatory factor (Ser/Thr protein kinase)